MTRDERIEAAAKAIYEDAPEMEQPVDIDYRPVGPAGIVPWNAIYDTHPEYIAELRRVAATILDAAYPELAGDKPTHWVAPMEMTESMYGEFVSVSDTHRVWATAREAYFKESGE